MATTTAPHEMNPVTGTRRSSTRVNAFGVFTVVKHVARQHIKVGEHGGHKHSCDGLKISDQETPDSQ